MPAAGQAEPGSTVWGKVMVELGYTGPFTALWNPGANISKTKFFRKEEKKNLKKDLHSS